MNFFFYQFPCRLQSVAEEQDRRNPTGSASVAADFEFDSSEYLVEREERRRRRRERMTDGDFLLGAADTVRKRSGQVKRK